MQWFLDTHHPCGGFDITTVERLDSIKEFELDNTVPLDQVYAGKVMLALKNKLDHGRIKQGSRILMIHTGGLQGKPCIK